MIEKPLQHPHSAHLGAKHFRACLASARCRQTWGLPTPWRIKHLDGSLPNSALCKEDMSSVTVVGFCTHVRRAQGWVTSQLQCWGCVSVFCQVMAFPDRPTSQLLLQQNGMLFACMRACSCVRAQRPMLTSCLVQKARRPSDQDDGATAVSCRTWEAGV